MNKTIKIISIIFAILLVAGLASALTISNVDTPNQIKPGESTDVRVTLSNDGNNDVKYVSIKLVLDNVPFAPFDSSSEKSIDEIKENDDESFTFKVIALNNAKSGIYKIPVAITYTEDVTPATPAKQISGLISLVVNSVPELDVSKEEGLLLKGKENSVILKIVNKGLSDVQFLEISVDSSYTLLSPGKVYIGTIASDDSDTAEFKILFSGNSANTVSLPVTLSYKDITNKQYTQNYNIDLRVYSQQEAISLGLIQKSNTGLYVSLIVVLIILYLVYRRVRKWMKNRKKMQENGK